MKIIQDITINYLMYLVLNKQKKTKPTTRTTTPNMWRILDNMCDIESQLEPPYHKVGNKPHLVPRRLMNITGPTGSLHVSTM